VSRPGSAIDEEHVLTLADGRRLAWAENGAPSGTPVLCVHGSPGSRLSRQTELDQLVSAGIRQLSYDRPGYGLSDPHPGRRVVDAVADVTAILDAAGVDRVAVVGGSGGGPHALALATLLPDRCTVVHCVVGVAPYDAPGLDFFDGMDPENQRRFHVARSGRDAAIAQYTVDVERLRDQMTDDPASLMGAMELPETDREILRKLGEDAMAALAEAFRQGVVGLVDDFIAMALPWGFDPTAAQAPVVLSYGEHDVNVPAGHGRWLAAHVPHREVRVNSDAGHLMTPEAGFALLVEAAAYG
jgi:pimeloyl-ACP methyl ester carboxylesterase